MKQLSLFVLLLCFYTSHAQVAGTLDSTFNNNGKLVTSFDFYSSFQDVLVQADGKILLAGTGGSGSAYNFYVVRLNTNGTYDNTFGTNGKVSIDFFNDYDQATTIGLQSDGKIIIGGKAFKTGNLFDFALARLSSSGVLDNTFGTGGKLTVDFNGNNDEGGKMVIQSDDKIVLTGTSAGATTGGFGTIRCTANGALDASFNSTGTVITLFPNGVATGTAAAVQADGKIVLCGANNIAGYPHLALARYNANGTIDAAFGTNGIVVYNASGPSSTAGAVKIQADGKIIAAGAVINTAGDILLYRCLPNGSADASFGTNGAVAKDLGATESANRLLLLSDGSYVVAGLMNTGSDNNFMVARFDAAGTINPNFGTNGFTTCAMSTQMSSPNDGINGLAIASDGKLVAAGYAGNDAGVIRLHNSGTEANAITEVETNAGLLLSPNPASSTLNLHFSTPTLSTTTITVFAMNGQVCLQQQVESGCINKSIAVETLASGMYLLQVANANGVQQLKWMKE